MPSPYFCNESSKRMFSFAEFVERLGVVYCKDCDPEMSPLPLEANSETAKQGDLGLTSCLPRGRKPGAGRTPFARGLVRWP
jgi:hypothetical protein